MMGVDVNALIYQVPGGMLSNLVSQLKQAGKSDKYDEVLKEVPRVREEFGLSATCYSYKPDSRYTGCYECDYG